MSSGYYVEIYKQRPSFYRWPAWRWRIKALNGEVVASSSEGYTRREDARRSVVRFAEETGASFADIRNV